MFYLLHLRQLQKGCGSAEDMGMGVILLESHVLQVDTVFPGHSKTLWYS